jgi:hypothetical protein
MASPPWPRNRRYEYAVEFESPDGLVFTPAWVEGLAWSTYYGPEGSGYGALTVRLPREVGFDYNDLGLGFDVRVRYGLETVLFHGQVRQVTENVVGGVSSISVTALGWGVVAGDDRLNWVFCDTRYGQWTVEPEMAGSYRPDRCSADQSDRLRLTLRSNQFYDQNDYGAIRYTLPAGQVLARVSADWELNVPTNWAGTTTLRVRTSAGENLLSQAADGSGSFDVNIAVGAPTWVEVQLLFTAAAGTNFAMGEDEDDIVWGEISSVKVYAEDTDDVTGDLIFAKLVEIASQSEHGLSDSLADVEAPDLALEPAVFDADWSLEKVAQWVTQFGDGEGNELAWGVRLDDQKIIFLEAIDKVTVGYSVRKSDQARAETAGDWQQSWQQRYAVYRDADGVVQRTADVEDEVTMEALGGYARRGDLQVSVTTDPNVVGNLLDLAIAEEGPMRTKSSVEVCGFVQSGGNGDIFCELMQAGKMVRVEDFRAREAALTSVFDLSDTYTTGLATVVEVDATRHTARVVLGTESDTLARYLAILGQLRGESQ